MKLNTPPVTSSHPPHSSGRRGAGPPVRAVRQLSQARGETDQRGGQQPAHLPAHVVAEQPDQAGRAAEPRARRAAETDRAASFPVQPAEAVVTQGELRARCCRWSRQYRAGGAGVSWTIATHQPAPRISAAPPASSCHSRLRNRGSPATRLGQRERRDHQEPLEHLGQERRTRASHRSAPATGCGPDSIARVVA